MSKAIFRLYYVEEDGTETHQLDAVLTAPTEEDRDGAVAGILGIMTALADRVTSNDPELNGLQGWNDHAEVVH